MADAPARASTAPMNSWRPARCPAGGPTAMCMRSASRPPRAVWFAPARCVGVDATVVAPAVSPTCRICARPTPSESDDPATVSPPDGSGPRGYPTADTIPPRCPPYRLGGGSPRRRRRSPRGPDRLPPRRRCRYARPGRLRHCRRPTAPAPRGWLGPPTCRGCRARLRTPTTVTVSVAWRASGWLALRFGADPALPALLAAAAIGLVLALVDLACLRLPDPLVLGRSRAGPSPAWRAARPLPASRPGCSARWRGRRSSRRGVRAAGGAARLPAGLRRREARRRARPAAGLAGLARAAGRAVLPHLLHGPVVLVARCVTRRRRSAGHRRCRSARRLLAGAWLAVLLPTPADDRTVRSGGAGGPWGGAARLAEPFEQARVDRRRGTATGGTRAPTPCRYRRAAWLTYSRSCARVRPTKNSRRSSAIASSVGRRARASAAAAARPRSRPGTPPGTPGPSRRAGSAA